MLGPPQQPRFRKFASQGIIRNSHPTGKSVEGRSSGEAPAFATRAEQLSRTCQEKKETPPDRLILDGHKPECGLGRPMSVTSVGTPDTHRPRSHNKHRNRQEKNTLLRNLPVNGRATHTVGDVQFSPYVTLNVLSTRPAGLGHLRPRGHPAAENA